jgi:hypothetical protein
MARPTHRSTLANYRGKIDNSRKWRKEEKYDKLWRRMIDLYRGKHFDHVSSEDQMLINAAFSTINVIAPSVAVNHPKITVGARKPEDGDKAIITEAIINYWWRHFDCQKQLRRAVDDYLIIGHGWLKVGYKFVEEERKKPAKPSMQEPQSDAPAPGHEMEQEMEDTSSDLDMTAEQSPMETEIVVTEDRPFVERVSPFDVFVDPDATSLEDAKWIAQRVRRGLLEVRNDQRYNRQARNDAQATQYNKWSGQEDRPRATQEDKDAYVDVWEFYDMKRGTMAVFCNGSDGFLVNPVPMPYAFGHPFVMIRNYDIPEHFYPMGELEAIEPLQYELNATRTQMMNHRKRFSRKWLYKENAFDTPGRDALESDEDNVMVPVISDEPLGAVVQAMPAVVNPPDMYNLTNQIMQDMDRVSGVAEFMRGGSSEISRTATESAMMQDAMNARTSDKLAEVERAIASSAKRLIGLAQQFLTGEHVARVVGSSAMPIWVNFDRDYILGEFDFEVEAGSTQPVNESFRRQMALQMVDAMAPFVGAGVVDMAALARHVLQFGFGVKTPEAFLAQPQQQGPVGPDGQPMQGPPPEQGPPQMGGLPAGIDPAAMMEGAPPAGGMPQPSNIPPQVLSMLQNSGAGLPNTM